MKDMVAFHRRRKAILAKEPDFIDATDIEGLARIIEDEKAVTDRAYEDQKEERVQATLLHCSCKIKAKLWF